ncbi:hypothetical protein Pfo_017411 [Paulownia fortunei]|nr:hypothetical protein Pfo_017411 [Paulownia fortunei]
MPVQRRHTGLEGQFQTKDVLSGVEHGDSFGHPKKVDIPRYAVINTSIGSITVELYKEGSPEVVNEFIDSCHKGRFKEMLFNRVIKNFVIQGGDVSRTGAAEDWTSRGSTTINLIQAKHDGGRFDLFITTAPIPDLNGKINVFGRIIKGEDVVQEIEEVDTDVHYRPKTPMGIIEVTLKQKV